MLQTVTQFEPAGAAALLEEEIREALVGTAGTVGGSTFLLSQPHPLAPL